VSAAIKHGLSCAFVGPRGCGKTTALVLLATQIVTETTKGIIYVGRDLQDAEDFKAAVEFCVFSTTAITAQELLQRLSLCNSPTDFKERCSVPCGNEILLVNDADVSSQYLASLREDVDHNRQICFTASAPLLKVIAAQPSVVWSMMFQHSDAPDMNLTATALHFCS